MFVFLTKSRILVAELLYNYCCFMRKYSIITFPIPLTFLLKGSRVFYSKTHFLFDEILAKRLETICLAINCFCAPFDCCSLAPLAKACERTRIPFLSKGFNQTTRNVTMELRAGVSCCCYKRITNRK